MSAPRVNDAGVKTILQTTIDTTAFCTTAHVLVDKLLPTGTLNEDQLMEIERFLAAHFACLFDARETAVQIGNDNSSFEGKTDMGLKWSRYGQQAIMLDTTGTLGALQAEVEKPLRRGRVVVSDRQETDLSGNIL